MEGWYHTSTAALRDFQFCSVRFGQYRSSDDVRRTTALTS